MLTVYSTSEIDGTPTSDIFKEPIRVIKHARTPNTNKDVVKAAVNGFEAVPKTTNYKYNHHIPYMRIFNHIQDTCLGKTRIEIFQWLQSVTRDLGIQPSKNAKLMLDAVGNASKSTLAFDAWMEWAVYSICDWPPNIFYGKGSGDGKGTKIDIPQTDKGALTKEVVDKQTTRVKYAATKLTTVLEGLSGADFVSVDKYAKIYTASGKETLKRVLDISSVDDSLTMQTQKKLKVDGPPLTGHLAMLESFADEDFEDDGDELDL